MQQKKRRKAEKGSKPTPSSVHVSCGRQRTEERYLFPFSEICHCLGKKVRGQNPGSTYWQKLVYPQVCSVSPSWFASQREPELSLASIIWTEWVLLWLHKNIIVLTNWVFFSLQLGSTNMSNSCFTWKNLYNRWSLCTSFGLLASLSGH